MENVCKTTLSKYISAAIDALLFTMGPGKFIKTTHFHDIDYDVMERYFTNVVLPVIENIFDLFIRKYESDNSISSLIHFAGSNKFLATYSIVKYSLLYCLYKIIVINININNNKNFIIIYF